MYETYYIDEVLPNVPHKRRGPLRLTTSINSIIAIEMAPAHGLCVSNIEGFVEEHESIRPSMRHSLDCDAPGTCSDEFIELVKEAPSEMIFHLSFTKAEDTHR